MAQDNWGKQVREGDGWHGKREQGNDSVGNVRRYREEAACGRGKDDDPSSVELRESIRRERLRLVNILVKSDWIELWETPRIEAKALEKVGALNVALARYEMEAQCAARKCALVREAFESGCRVDRDRIEHQVRCEFIERREEIISRERLNSARAKQGNRFAELGREDLCEMVALHRELVIRLHPFLNPDSGDGVRSKLALARLALKRANVPMMRFAETSSRQFAVDFAELSRGWGLDELHAELAITQAKIAVAQEDLDHVLSHESYRLHDLVENPKRVDRSVRRLQERIEGQKELAALYQARYLELLDEAV